LSPTEIQGFHLQWRADTPDSSHKRNLWFGYLGSIPVNIVIKIGDIKFENNYCKIKSIL